MKNFVVALIAAFLTLTSACGSNAFQQDAVPSDAGTTPVVTIVSDGGSPSGCAEGADCQYPTAATCVVTADVGVCTYVACGSACTGGWVCDTVATPNHCRPPEEALDAGVAIADAGVLTPDGGTTPPADGGSTTPLCATYCPADNTCQIDAIHNTVTCIPPVVDAGTMVALPADAGTQVLADAGVVVADAGIMFQDAGTTPPPDAGVSIVDAGVAPTLTCADVCPASNTCVVDVIARVIVCIPPTPVDAGTVVTPPADAGTQVLVDAGVVAVDAGTTVQDAGTTPPPDAGVSIADAGTLPADAGTLPADAGVAPVADGGIVVSLPPVFPTGVNKMVRVCMAAGVVRYQGGHVAVFGNPMAWGTPYENTTLCLDSPVNHTGTVDATIHMVVHAVGAGVGDALVGTDGQFANQLGFSEVATFVKNATGEIQRWDLIPYATYCGGKLVVPLNIVASINCSLR